jgi:hypothetical protein
VLSAATASGTKSAECSGAATNARLGMRAVARLPGGNPMTMRRSFRWFVLALLGASLAACHFHHHRGGGHCFRPPVRHCR